MSKKFDLKYFAFPSKKNNKRKTISSLVTTVSKKLLNSTDKTIGYRLSERSLILNQLLIVFVIALNISLQNKLYCFKDNPDICLKIPKEFSLESPSKESLRNFAQQAATKFNVSREMVLAIGSVESNFNPFAKSHKGAYGCMQLMPITARHLGVSDPKHPLENIGAGVRYLRLLLDQFEGDEELTIAAYNAGPTRVRATKSVPKIKETMNYVVKVKKKMVEEKCSLSLWC